MIITKYFLLIVFIFFVLISISISINKKDAFQILSDNDNILVKRQIQTSSKNSLELVKSIVTGRTRTKLNVHQIHSWKNPIPYYVDKHVDRGIVFNILKNIELETCLRFQPVYEISRKNQPIIYEHVKSSQIKKHIFFKQYIDPKCYTLGYTYRETFHTLGLVYEHQRRSRDLFIYFNRSAISKSAKKYFDKVDVSVADTANYPFDYGSVLLPDQYFLSTKGAKTMLPAYNLYQQTMGQDIYPSFIDFKRLNSYYCSTNCHQKITCKHGGYPHPELCTQCKCIFGHTGPFCEKFNKRTRLCPLPVQFASYKEKYLGASGIRNCAYVILAPPNKHIMVKILGGTVSSGKRTVCSPDNTLEVKYLSDKVTTGARFCGKLPKLPILSRSSSVYIYFKSKDPRNKFTIRFKTV